MTWPKVIGAKSAGTRVNSTEHAVTGKKKSNQRAGWISCLVERDVFELASATTYCLAPQAESSPAGHADQLPIHPTAPVRPISVAVL